MDKHEEHGRSTRYTLIALIFFGNVLSYVDRQVLALLKPTLVGEFGWTDAEFAHLGSVFTLAMAGSVFFAGLLVDKFGVRRAYGVAVGLWSLAGMAHAAAMSVGQFVMARAALALSESVGGPATVKASAQYLPLRERSVGLGIISMAPNIGAVVAPLIVPLLAITWGWKSAFLITGGLGLVWVGLWFRATRSLAVAKQTIATRPAEPIAWRELLTDRRTWAITFTKALADMVFWFMLFWIPDLFGKVFHLNQAQIAGPIALSYALAALGALAAGVLFPALLRHGVTLNAARKLSMLAFALMFLPVPLALDMPNAWLAAAIIGLALFAHNGFVTNIFGLIADVVPLKRVATVMAMSSVAGNLAGMGMIEFAGWSLTNGYGYLPMFVVASLAYLAATVLLQVMIPTLRVAESSEQS